VLKSWNERIATASPGKPQSASPAVREKGHNRFLTTLSSLTPLSFPRGPRPALTERVALLQITGRTEH